MRVVVFEQKMQQKKRFYVKKLQINFKKVVDKEKKVLYYVYMEQPVAHLGVSGVFTKNKL